MSNHVYDCIILGGGPGGYTAAMYNVRAGIDTVVLEKLSAGGQMCQTPVIDNYPGFEEGIDGFTLGYKMQQCAERFGAVTKQTEVLSVELDGDIKTVVTDSGTLYAKTVIIATGADHRHLGIDQEESLIGKGVGYCAACDGMLYRGKIVTVVGGGNSAASDAILLSKICQKVYVIHRRDTLRASKIYHEPIKNIENIEFKWNSVVTELLHENRLSGIRIKDVNTDAETEIACDGLFISIGRNPSTEIFKGQVELDKSGYVVADESTRTNIDGVFAVGDVRTKVVRQVVTATADGAVASHFVEEYLASGGK